MLLSFRNLADTRVLPVNEAEVQDYVWARSVLFTEPTRPSSCRVATGAVR